MKIYCCIFVTFVFLWTTTQARSVTSDLWQPEHGTREEYMECFGVPCEQWKRAESKLAMLKLHALDDRKAADATHMADQAVPKNDTTPNLLDGCILLTEAQMDELLEEQRNSVHGRKKRAMTTTSFQKWTVFPIPWKFDGRHSETLKEKIRGAFQHWTEQTCIRFREVGTHERITTNHILVSAGSGCYSHVGMVDLKPQFINLQAQCVSNFGTPVHEIGHSLGLWHEQQRWDRDDTVHVLMENLGYYRGQFLKLHDSDLNMPYDVTSVMHYGPKAGSVNGKNTMETINPLYQRNMGQRTGLSFLDTKSINMAYCRASCPNRLARPCERDGYQDPNHCDRCRCPDGFSGTYCQDVASSVNANCGGVIHATSTPQYIMSPGYDTDKHYGNRQQCNWIIKAPANHRVVLNFEDEFGLYCHNSGECHHWVEVRTGANLGRPGARFCCYRKPTSVLWSETDEMVVVFRTNWTVPWNTAKRGFKASFYTEFINGANKVPTKIPTTRPTTTTTSTTTTSTTTSSPPTTTTTPSPTTTTMPTLGSSRYVWRCSFEDNSGTKTLCGMQQMTNDNFDWTMQRGSTPSDETGPRSAIADSRPYYIYIEASSPRRYNDKAIITIPQLYSSGAHCVTFNYHMYGFHINELRLAKMNSWNEPTPVWQQSKDHGDKWLSARVDVTMDNYHKLAFVGVIGHEYSGDIAIDNIEVTKGRC